MKNNFASNARRMAGRTFPELDVENLDGQQGENGAFNVDAPWFPQGRQTGHCSYPVAFKPNLFCGEWGLSNDGEVIAKFRETPYRDSNVQGQCN
jgi:hypothetical protein